MKKFKQAVIFSGGRGARLMPLTKNLPKPLVELNGIPFSDYLISFLAAQGFKKILFLTGYKKERFKNYYRNNRFGVEIEFSEGKTNEETGTRLKNGFQKLDEHFLLLYGDNFCRLNFSNMEEFFLSNELDFSTTVYSNLDGKGEYGFENNAHRDSSGFIKRYDKSRKAYELNCVDIGFFLIKKDSLKTLFDEIPFKNFSFEKSLLKKVIKEKKLYGFLTDETYKFITSIDTMLECEKFLMKNELIFPKLF